MFRPYTVLVSLVFLTGSAASQAEEPGKIDLEAATMVAELVGAPVFARDGEQVGEVIDVSFDEELQPIHLRMSIDANLGIGSRTLDIGQGAFLTLRGAVVVEFSGEALRTLSEWAEREEMP